MGVCVAVWLCGCLAMWVFVWVSGCVGRQQVPVCGGDAQFTDLVLSLGFGSSHVLCATYYEHFPGGWGVNGNVVAAINSKYVNMVCN